ncbi:tRNA pseudouridine(38-40) synthase TruA [Jutongia huaianensis]|uniref:tRNA pseudouridine synthase A n=1 Tax=Jutongia huaianensis TaxID=2763668 RepID=A0ABR7N0W5_9FIRM|nr:tRNA pseudouridine(38-40) synthase TruA [Jutongia huaianensis]MBC8562275.1 tRNA pseudouridine(38-40) synthase TruA [Jutongia huaianensis]
MASENSDKMTSELHTTRRILLRVAYDGTNYHGWQVQPNAKTIEGELNRVLTQLTGEKIQVTGASRTDAGVHALGNVAVFDTVSKIPAEKFSYALNQRLPEDIVIQSSLQVADDFHPRHCDCRKTYEYDILNRTFPLPAYRNTAYFLYGDLDLDAMRKACQAFLGEHDFASFCAAGAQVQTTVRTIYSLEVLEQPLAVTGRGSKPASEVTGADPICQPTETAAVEQSQRSPERLMTIRVRGNGFLYNMVRIIAGTLVEVGRGHIRPEEIEGIIAACDRAKAGPTAPARGLRLVEIKYD